MMKFQPWDVLTIRGLMSTQAVRKEDGRWIPAEPLKYGGPWQRIYCAWLVLAGKARAVQWPS